MTVLGEILGVDSTRPHHTAERSERYIHILRYKSSLAHEPLAPARSANQDVTLLEQLAWLDLRAVNVLDVVENQLPVLDVVRSKQGNVSFAQFGAQVLPGLIRNSSNVFGNFP